MADSKYPSNYDSDVEIPRVDDNITEIGGEAINGLRSALFHIEETLGLSPQGSATDVVTRLDTSLNADGTIKASALSTVGLVTLPITDVMIATDAAIEESKLDLDYATVTLRNDIDWNYAEIKALMSALTIDIGHLSSHVAHPSIWGRHYTSDIDGYSGTAYDGYNLQGIVQNLNTRIINHLADAVAAHAASAISFDPTGIGMLSADNVQDAIAQADALIEGATIIHQDRQHSNGVLKAQEVKQVGTGHSYAIVSSATLFPVSINSIAVQFVTAPTDFSTVDRGDQIDITINGKIYTRDIDRIDSSTSSVYFHIPIPVSGTSTASIYKNPAETIAPSSVNIAIRQSNISSTGGSIIQMVHPKCPYVLGSGIDTRGLTNSYKNIKLKWAADETPDINIYTLMIAFSAYPNNWTVENLSIVLNTEFATNNYPLISFTYNGQLGIAYDAPDGYLVIEAPSANSAWAVLGFSSGEKAYSLERCYYIDGYRFTDLRNTISASGEIDAGNTNEITTIDKDLRASGLKASGLIRVSSTASDNGTYVYDIVNDSDTLTISEHSFTVDASVNVNIYADTFNVATAPSKRTLYELFVDGYDHSGGVFGGLSRVEYYKEPTTSPQDISPYFDVIDISRDFPAGTRRVIYVVSGTVVTITLGTRHPSSGISLLLAGPTLTLPVAGTSVPGYRFKLYDYTGIDYIEFEVVQDYTPLSTGNAIDIDIYTRPSEERYLQVGKVLHNRTEFKHMADRRLFGSVGRKDVRDDFIRDYTTYPNSVLRGNGVIRDCTLTYTLSESVVYFSGGEALVNGMIVSVPMTTLNIPADGVAGTLNLYIDENGILRFLKPYISSLCWPSTEEIILSTDKLILYRVTVDDSNLITDVDNLKRYVSHVDNKIEITIGDTRFCSFATLKSAVNYLNASDVNLQKTIKINGVITYNLTNGPITLPNNTILMGDGKVGSGDSASKLYLTDNGGSIGFIEVGDNCTVKDLTIEMATGSSLYSVIGYATSAINGLNLNNCYFILSGASTRGLCSFTATFITVENCYFSFTGAAGAYSTAIEPGSISDSIISNCDFISTTTVSKTFVLVETTANNLIIKNCIIRNGNLIVAVDPAICDGLIITNNTILNTTSVTTSGYSLFDFFNITDSIVSENIIEISNFNKAIFNCAESLENVYFINNIINVTAAITVATEALMQSAASASFFIIGNTIQTLGSNNGCIFITDSTTGLFIKDNNINIGGITSTGDAIRFSGSELYYAYITNNSIINSSSSAVTNNVIYLTGSTQQWILIHNNIIKNASYYGFLSAIKVDSGDNAFLTISNNIISNFNASLSQTIKIEDGVNFIITNNIFTADFKTILFFWKHNELCCCNKQFI
jgi:hypothetical protein